MKVNLWMIANRLTDYEVDVNIAEKEDANIDSALLVRAPGCAYVYQSGTDLVCEYDHSSILVRDLPLRDGYLLIQNIINWYQWAIQKADDAIIQDRPQLLADICCQIFGNPVLIQDPNYNLLGLTEGSWGESLPPEWKAMKQTGHSSMEGFVFMANALRFPVDVYRNHVRRFRGQPDSVMPQGGLHASITFQSNSYGMLTVLETGRRLNYGDIRILEYLSRRMAIYLAAISGNERRSASRTLIESLLTGETVSDAEIQYYQKLLEQDLAGAYAVMLIAQTEKSQKRYRNDDGTLSITPLLFLKSQITRAHPSVACTLIRGQLLVLLYTRKPVLLARQIICDAGLGEVNDEVRVGISGEFSNLKELPYFFAQAVHAQSFSKGGLSEFYPLALNYLVDNLEYARPYACEPTLRALWSDESKRDFLEALGVYLAEERSTTRAAARLFIHKNTLTYRIKYLKDQYGWDLEDTYTRDYFRMSLHILSREQQS